MSERDERLAEQVQVCTGCSQALHERRVAPGGVSLWTCNTEGCGGNLSRLGVDVAAEKGATEEERLREITVTSCGLDDAAQDALFDRVAEAAHALDEQVSCFGGPASESLTSSVDLVEYAIREWAFRASGLLLKKASARMGEFGPHDARGAATWDCGTWLWEHAVDEVMADLAANPPKPPAKPVMHPCGACDGYDADGYHADGCERS